MSNSIVEHNANVLTKLELLSLQAENRRLKSKLERIETNAMYWKRMHDGMSDRYKMLAQTLQSRTERYPVNG